MSQPRRVEHDGEPGIFSLSQIMHLMRVEFDRAQRYGYPVSCLLVSVDRLAELRDLYGYDSKEAILDEIVRLLQAHTRNCDFLGRLADDRLLAVVPHTPMEGARLLGERLIQSIRELKFETEGRRLRITVSVGASHNAGGQALFFDTLLAAAEGALAEASAEGGDRFVQRDPVAGAG